ncbi:MAG: AbrB/MazE/SpoVT family DNA-binding domain-containing protein [Chloroflexi bacterium]|nr:AbrB/MazE/SpoVT family DNA-binding domain-containing protein [Chloroflexota bacterium]
MELEGVTATATLSEKGWLVIPRDFREKYGLKKGDKVRVIDCGTFIAIVSPLKTPIQEGLGLLPPQMRMTDELLESRRAELAREEKGLWRWPRRD